MTRDSLLMFADEHKDCASGEQYCGTGECVADKKVCDYGFDCGDHSDEYNCRELLCTDIFLLFSYCTATVKY